MNILKPIAKIIMYGLFAANGSNVMAEKMSSTIKLQRMSLDVQLRLA